MNRNTKIIIYKGLKSLKFGKVNDIQHMWIEPEVVDCVQT